MTAYIQILIFILIGTILLWFGYTLFFSIGRPVGQGTGKVKKRKFQKVNEGYPGAPRTCPVCSALLEHGERVKSSAFPAMGGADRLMHIGGCMYCLEGERVRKCPVCGHALLAGEILIARLFDKPRRSHVHVLGCSRCKGPQSGR